MKSITIIPATGGQFRDITIEPGTTARDIKTALELSAENVLTKGKGAEPIPDGENLYETLADGAKLYATTAIEFGGLLDWLFGAPVPATKSSSQRVRISRTYSKSGSRITAVPRTTAPYWAERGWVRKEGVYSGEFQTPFGHWSGWIFQSPGGRIDTYIATPPCALERHPHWPCFRKQDNGWFFIHPISDVPDVSAAIISVEKTLTEAFNRN